ncbi:hypothetical protein ACFYT4_33970 [Streptomyces sp. NPDC004609]|uniref:hypothetical protein n=1 Tax=Streptomyces sp. NPDC004609 TaxID=3364704 RepID=UPI0036A67FA7
MILYINADTLAADGRAARDVLGAGVLRPGTTGRGCSARSRPGPVRGWCRPVGFARG